MIGDIRLNVQPTLTGLHLLFVREHNRIADELEALNPQWRSRRTEPNRDRIFLETRKIVIALMQQITYSDYMNSMYLIVLTLTNSSAWLNIVKEKFIIPKKSYRGYVRTDL